MLTNKKAKKGFKLSVKFACDCALVVGAILIIIALALSGTSVKAFNVLMIIACAIYIAASLTMLVKSVMVICDKTVNRRSPEYKQAIGVTVVAAVVFGVAVFGLIFALTL